jgi:chromosome segregation ATPase
MEESPENNGSAVLSNLSLKTQKVPEYGAMISELAHEKNDLAIRIENLKRKIGLENKSIAGLRHSHNQLHNHIANKAELLARARADADRASYNADIAAADCGQLKREIAQLNTENVGLKQSCAKELAAVEQLKDFCITTKQSVLREDKKLGEVKANLTVSLKAMDNASAAIKLLD